MTPQQLKNSLLQRAIEGRLVEQRPEEGTAKDLLKEIRAEKERMIEDGKIKKSKPLPPITEDEKPFEIPDGWEWVRLGDLCSKIGSGNTPYGGRNSGVYKIKGVPLFREQNIYNDGIDYKGIVYISQELSDARQGSKVYAKDLLLNITGGSIGRCAVVPDDFNVGDVNQHILIIRLINSNLRKYLHGCICGPLGQNTINVKAVGARAGFSAEKCKNMLIPLPPLAEQHRIVSKIEELLPLIDKYNKAYTKLTAYNAHFPEAMKKSILQYAIQGKLVEQRPEEGTAKDLLKEIRAEKERLIEEGKIKKSKPLPPITEDEKPFEIPEGWEWVRLWDIVHNHGQEKPNKPFTYIDIGSVDNSKQKLGKEENIIQPEDAPSRARKILEKGDIIYSTVRPYLHNMCIIDRDFSRPPIASTGFAVMKTLTGVSNKYLFYYLLSPTFDTYANSNENAKGVAYPAINDKALYSSTVPLPPLAEQHRIVSKIEELLPLCEKLVK